MRIGCHFFPSVKQSIFSTQPPTLKKGGAIGHQLKLIRKQIVHLYFYRKFMFVIKNLYQTTNLS